MANKFCQYCGSQMDASSTFCQSCGKSQDSSNPTPPVAYAQPNTNYNQGSIIKDTPLSIGQYLGIFLLSAIPVVGFILLLVWAFDSDTNVNKKNYARAALIMGIIAAVFSVIFFASIAGIIMGILNNFS